MNRRNMLAGISAVALAPACNGEEPGERPRDTELPTAPDRAPEPAPWEPTGTLDEVAFAWGVASGDAGPDRVRAGVRTLEAAVAFELVRAEGEGWVQVESREGLVPVGGVVQISLSGLTADAVYRYVFRSSDGARRSAPGRFRTALASDGFRKLIGATSCLGHGEPTFATLAGAAAEDLDLMLLLGDLVYADDSVTVEDYRGEWRRLTGKESVRALLASTSVVATWDDHEIANNWTRGESTALQDHVEPEQIEAGLAAFREAIPQEAGASDLGLWRSIVWGEVLEIIALDSRGERDDNLHIVSDEQLAWGIERLQQSTATFKLVLCSVHMTDHEALLSFVNQEDRWQGYPTQREALLAAAEGVSGVLFVTGDMHYGAIQKVSAAGAVGEALWEIAAGPGGSDLFELGLIAELAGGFPEQYADVVDDWTWARLELDPATVEVTVQLVNSAGTVLAERVLALG